MSDAIQTLIQESRVMERQGDWGGAWQSAWKAHQFARKGDDPEALAGAAVQLAFIEFRLGHFAQAQEYASETLTLSGQYTPSRAMALRVLGNCSGETKSLDLAEGYYQQAVDLSRQIGEHSLHGHALHGLGNGVYFPRGQFALALAAEEEALRIFEVHEDAVRIYLPLLTMTWIYQVTGQAKRAWEMLSRMETVIAEDVPQQGYRTWLQANLEMDAGHFEPVPALLLRTRAEAERVGEPGLNLLYRMGYARFYRLVEQPGEAYDWANDAHRMAVRLGYEHARGQALVARGRAAWAKEEYQQARADFQAAILALAPLDARYDLAEAYFFLAALSYFSPHGQVAPEAETVVFQQAVHHLIQGGYAFLLERERTLAFPLLAALMKSSDKELALASSKLTESLVQVPPPSLNIHLMGDYQVWQGPRLIDQRALRQRRAGELFALLLTTADAPIGSNPQRTKTLFFDQVAEALWPEKETEAAMMLFHHATSMLRRVLEPDLPEKFPSRYLFVEEGRVTLKLPLDSTVDVDLFEKACHEQAWERALQLYTGELLPEFSYTEWAQLPRQRFQQIYQHAMLCQSETWVANGRYHEAVEGCRRILELEPWQEQAVLIGMKACLGLKDLAGARRLYLVLEKKLGEELRVKPQAELQMLYKTL